MPTVKRSRRERSEATRRAIIAAAVEEFSGRGYHGATMAAIAARAGVATQTVYFVFHTKAALISACIDSLVMGPLDGADPPTIPQESAWWKAMIAEPDAAEAVRHFVRGAGPLYQRASFVSEVLRAAALTDEELAVIHEHHEELRAVGFHEVIATVSAKGPLREGLTVDTATDVLLVTYSDATYVLLTKDRGWTHEQTVEWFCDALPRLLLEDRPGPT